MRGYSKQGIMIRNSQDLIIKLYIHYELSIREICRKLKVGRNYKTVISAFFKKKGVKTRRSYIRSFKHRQNMSNRLKGIEKPKSRVIIICLCCSKKFSIIKSKAKNRYFMDISHYHKWLESHWLNEITRKV